MEFLKIANRKNFLLGEVPAINPHSRKYLSYWREQRKRCVDGMWSIDDANVDVDISVEKPIYPESNSWRYIPPVCYFYVNFGTIMRNRKGATSGAKVPSRPDLDDVEWEFHYNWIEARGFSGFEFDEVYSCNRLLLDEDYTDEVLHERCLDENGRRINELYYNFFTKKGDRKIYISVRQYIRQLFDKNMGRPIYGNIPKNMMVLATRDGGKSYLTGGVISHEVLFDGVRRYVRNDEKKPIAEIVVGASISDKSRDLLKKAKMTIDNLPGAWKKDTADEIPAAFFKHMAGSLGANKDWTHKYDKKIGGGWKTVEGSSVKHRVFTTENPEAAAGGRPGTIVVEEVGLMGNVIHVHGGNVAAQNDGGEKFGSSIYIGTAGNIDKIIESELIFNSPEGFDMLEFDNIWEPEQVTKIAWFIPATHMARRFKDANGNTKIAEAMRHFEKDRQKAARAATRKALETMMMNYPLVPSEMFVNADDNKFPVKDLKYQYSKLLGSKKELTLSYKVEFIINDDNSIDFRNVKKQPIREYPLKNTDKANMEGCPEIFIMPIRGADGKVPPNVYLSGQDPIDDDDNSDVTRSLQSLWIMNRFTGELVFEYTGRTASVSDFYEQCRRALIFYNARCNYENNKKGFHGHMVNKSSTYLLVETPEILMQKGLQKSTGIGNKALGTSMNSVDTKVYGLDLLEEWLVTPIEKGSEKMMLHTIKSPALLRELMSFKPDKNFDRISALLVMLILREDKRRIVKKVKEKIKSALDDDFFKDTWDDQVHNNLLY